MWFRPSKGSQVATMDMVSDMCLYYWEIFWTVSHPRTPMSLAASSCQLQLYRLKLFSCNYVTISDFSQPLHDKHLSLPAPILIIGKYLMTWGPSAFITHPHFVVQWNIVQVLLESVSPRLWSSIWLKQNSFLFLIYIYMLY